MKICYQSFINEALAPEYLAELQAHLDAAAGLDTEVDLMTLTPADSYAHPAVELRCARQVLGNAIRAEREGYDAFVLGHMQDSGLWECKSVVDIPVLGLGECSMLHACTLGMRIGIVTINRRFIPGFHQQIKRYGLEQRVVGVDAMSFEPGEITAAFASQERFQQAAKSFEKQAAPLVEQGVDVLIPGGGIPMLLFGKQHGFNVGGAPVLNGLPVLIKMTEMAVSLKRETGVAMSRTGDMGIPPEHVLEELLQSP